MNRDGGYEDTYVKTPKGWRIKIAQTRSEQGVEQSACCRVRIATNMKRIIAVSWRWQAC